MAGTGLFGRRRWGFLRLLERFRRARGSLPFILVAPCTFSNVNRISGPLRDMYNRFYSEEVISAAGGDSWIPDVNRRLDWDEIGLLTILDDLEETCGARRHVYVAGFSGGGLLTYRLIFRHPDRLVAAVAVCPNFNFWKHGYDSDADASKDRAVPIHLVLGESDPFRPARFGGRFYPVSSAALLGVSGAMAGVVWLVWNRTRSRRKTILAAVIGGVIIGLLSVGRWSGNEAQTDFAARLLRERGYTNVRRVILTGLGHEPATEYVFKTFVEIHSNASAATEEPAP